MPWPDLTPFTDLEVHDDASGLVWGGRVWDATPGARDTIGVTARGWQYLLDDDPTRKTYFRNGTQGFLDIRSVPGVNLTTALQPASVGSAIGIGWTHPIRQLIGTEQVGVVLDLGDSVGKAIAVDYVHLNNATASIAFYVNGHDNWQMTSGGVTAYSSVMSSMASSGTVTGTFSSPKRYVSLVLVVTSTHTPAFNPQMQITDVRIAADAAWMDGSGDSTLTASDVATDIHTDLTSVLSSDTSRIETTAFEIDSLTTEGQYETPRQTLQRANAYHDYLVGVDAHRRLFFRARPTTPLIQIGDDTGASYADAGDTGEDLYNQVIVTGLQPDGTTRNETRTATSPILNLNGYTRTKILTTQAPLTTAAAQAIGDAWLTRRKDRPTRGTVTINGHGAATMVTNGAPVTPAELLQHPGEILRVADRWSPDDGANARDGVITNVTWDADTDAASITLDSPRNEFEQLLTRYAALRAARPVG